MFNESSQMILTESTQIVLNIGYVLALIGVIWKIATDHNKTRHDIEHLKKEKEEHKEEHKDIKKVMDIYQEAIHDLKTELKTSLKSNELQFKMIETKLDQTQTMILSMQSSNNDTQRELISTIKNMDIERRKNNV